MVEGRQFKTKTLAVRIGTLRIAGGVVLAAANSIDAT
jgi:hypothetical protein